MRPGGQGKELRYDTAGDHHVIVARLDVGEAFEEAAGELVGHGILAVLLPTNSQAEGDPVDAVCEIAKTVLDVKGAVAEWVGETVRRIVEHALLASGPIGVGVAFFVGKAAENLVGQALGSDEQAERRTDVIDLGNVVLDALDGRLLESGPLREHIEKFFGQEISDVLSDPLIATGTACLEPTRLATVTIEISSSETASTKSPRTPTEDEVDVIVVTIAHLQPRYARWEWVRRVDGEIVYEVRLLPEGTLQSRRIEAPLREWQDLRELQITYPEHVEGMIRHIFEYLCEDEYELRGRIS